AAPRCSRASLRARSPEPGSACPWCATTSGRPTACACTASPSTRRTASTRASRWCASCTRGCRRRGRRCGARTPTSTTRAPRRCLPASSRRSAGASDADFVPEKQALRFRRDRWMFEYGVRHADAIIVQNAFQQETCYENYGRRATVIPSAYAPPVNATADENGSVLWVGTIRDYKQPELLLEMARRLPQLRFVMVGGAGGLRQQDIRYFEGVKREAQSLRNVEFAGFVPYAGVEAYFNRARVFVNTSRFEGFPNTFLQAWARGVPTVSFVDTGSRRGLEPIYAVVRDVSAAVQEIGRLMLDDDHWQAASARCRMHYWTHHSMSSVTARYTKALMALGGGR